MKRVSVPQGTRAGAVVTRLVKERDRVKKRIIIWARPELKGRWYARREVAGVEDNEEFAERLLDLYDAAARAFGTEKIDVLVKILRELGVGVKIVER